MVAGAAPRGGRRRALPLALGAAAAAAALAACDRAPGAGTDTAAANVAPATAPATDALPAVRAGALTIRRLVAPAPVADAPMALYLEVANGGAAADTLLGVEVDGARAASLHATVAGRMRPVAVLAMPPGATAALRPGGLHLMVEGLAPTAGDTVRATLRFARAGAVRVAAPVVAYADLERLLGAAPAGAAQAAHDTTEGGIE